MSINEAQLAVCHWDSLKQSPLGGLTSGRVGGHTAGCLFTPYKLKESPLKPRVAESLGSSRASESYNQASEQGLNKYRALSEYSPHPGTWTGDSFPLVEPSTGECSSFSEAWTVSMSSTSINSGFDDRWVVIFLGFWNSDLFLGQWSLKNLSSQDILQQVVL